MTVPVNFKTVAVSIHRGATTVPGLDWGLAIDIVPDVDTPEIGDWLQAHNVDDAHTDVYPLVTPLDGASFIDANTRAEFERVPVKMVSVAVEQHDALEAELVLMAELAQNDTERTRDKDAPDQGD